MSKQQRNQKDILISKKRLEELLSKFSGKKIGVVGDIMLDRYYWGSVTRISPEAPVPVCLVERESSQLGGAANVANNVKMLGALPVLFGVIGEDPVGAEILADMKRQGLPLKGIISEKGRHTTSKLRIVAEDQHVVRVDRETAVKISTSSENAIIDEFAKQVTKLDAVVLEDYNKGVLSKKIIKQVINLSRDRKIPIAVDPKFDNFYEYKGATVVKPNRVELERATNSKIIYPGSENLVAETMAKLECDQFLLTLGRYGMVLTQKTKPVLNLPAYEREVHDVSGAGDTVISMYTLCLACGSTPEEATFCANLGAAVACGKVGAQPIGPDEILEAYDFFHRQAKHM